jgi:putative ABC transport system permease protein
MTLWTVAARNTLRNKFRASMTVLGGAVAIVAFVMLRTVLGGWNVGVEFAAKDRLATRNKVSFAIALPKRYAEQVESVPGVNLVTYQNWFGGKLAASPDEFFANLATADNGLEAYPEVELDPASAARWKGDKAGALVGDLLASKFHWKIGDKVVLQGTIYPGDWEFTIDGIYTAPRRSAIPRSNFWFHWGYLNDRVPPSQKEKIGWIVTRIDDPSRSADVAARIDRMFDDSDVQTETMSEQAINNSLLGAIGAVLDALDVVSVVILAIMMLVLGNTIAMGVRERSAEYGVLRAIGFEPRHIRAFIVGEALTLSLVTSIVGLALAIPLVRGASAFLEASLGQFFPYFRMTMSPFTAAVAVIVTLCLGALAALVPAIRAGRVPVADALRRIG